MLIYYTIRTLSIKALIVIYALTILAPKGNNASFANLKHCSPKGIPTIVIQSTKPLVIAAIARGSPPKKSHKTLISVEKPKGP